jgi:uncharacterized protein with von Willebrand factor type A (vWA) domain
MSSDQEILQAKDFAQMSAAEIAARGAHHREDEAAARREADCGAFAPIRMARGSIRARTLRASACAPAARSNFHRLGRNRQAADRRALRYFGLDERLHALFLHFLHALTDARKRVHTVFLFGTRLTNVTRALRRRDPDEALAMCSPDGRGLVGRHAHRRRRCTSSTSCGAAACWGRARSCC